MKNISHSGIVVRSDNNKVYVKIVSKSACSGCHAKQACGVSDQAEKIIEVNTNEFSNYNVNDDVIVSISQDSTVLVVILAYILPTIVIIATLLILSMSGIEDNISGIITLIFVFCYFFMLFLFKNRINNKIKITISK